MKSLLRAMWWLVAALAVAASREYVVAQPAPSGAHFEVVSIKPHKAGDPKWSSMLNPGGLYVGTNVTLHTLMRIAFDVRQVEIAEEPAWARTERFDVIGKAAGNPSPEVLRERVRPMVAQLLSDRFRLRFHREPRVRPVYAVAFNTGTQLGPQLKRASAACTEGRGRVNPNVKVSRPCGSGYNRQGELSATGMAFRNLLISVATWVDRPLVDQTKIEGLYDWHLTWDQSATKLTEPPPFFTPENPAGRPGLSLFTAIREQLGLELKPTRARIDVVIIDAAQRPSSD